MDTFVKLNVEHVLYPHCRTAMCPKLFNTQSLYLPEYFHPQNLANMRPHSSNSIENLNVTAF